VKILVATHNPAKKKEIVQGLADYLDATFEIISLDDLHITKDVEETGKTFEENAKLKAHFYAKLTGLPVVADDGGLMIDALGGEPGIHTKRWLSWKRNPSRSGGLGRESTDEEMVAYTLERLNGISEHKRTAAFRTVLCFFDPKTNVEFLQTAEVRGRIATNAYAPIPHGYPYRALFIVDGINKYYAEFTPDEHHAYNHRIHALTMLSRKINEWYNNVNDRHLT
jgi:XTP/dITP diphosphohydrolase